MTKKSRAAQLAQRINAGEFQADPVAMTPDATVVWDQHRLPDNLGTLLVAPGCSEFVVGRMARLALGPDRWPGQRRGGYSRVRLAGGIAFKGFRVYGAAHHHGLQALRANVGLSEGLRRIDNVVGDWRIVAPTYSGALIRPDAHQPGAWAMTDEPGKHPLGGPNWDKGLPSDIMRELKYREALMACGVDPIIVALDDGPRNLLVRMGTSTPFELVKLDVFIDQASAPRRSVLPSDEPPSFVAAG